MLPDFQDVHVWFVELSTGNAVVEQCSRNLSADERQRASRFQFEHLRSAFTVSRSILRLLLARYLQVEPTDIRFSYGVRGKPQLAWPAVPFAFNLAHSGRLAAYAFAIGCEVGIDLEEIRSIPEQQSLVRSFFSREEFRDWMDLKPRQRNEAFFLGWTRKEAYIKAVGDGLSLPLDSFQMSLRPDEPARLIREGNDHASATRWAIFSFAPVEGYVGALALPELNRSLRVLPLLTAEAVLTLTSSDTFPP